MSPVQEYVIGIDSRCPDINFVPYDIYRVRLKPLITHTYYRLWVSKGGCKTRCDRPKLWFMRSMGYEGVRLCIINLNQDLNLERMVNSYKYNRPSSLVPPTSMMQ